MQIAQRKFGHYLRVKGDIIKPNDILRSAHGQQNRQMSICLIKF